MATILVFVYVTARLLAFNFYYFSHLTLLMLVLASLLIADKFQLFFSGSFATCNFSF